MPIRRRVVSRAPVHAALPRGRGTKHKCPRPFGCSLSRTGRSHTMMGSYRVWRPASGPSMPCSVWAWQLSRAHAQRGIRRVVGNGTGAPVLASVSARPAPRVAAPVPVSDRAWARALHKGGVHRPPHRPRAPSSWCWCSVCDQLQPVDRLEWWARPGGRSNLEMPKRNPGPPKTRTT